MTQVVWNREWIKPFESPWSIFEKFCFANIVKRSELLKKYGISDVRKIKGSTIGDHHRDLRTLDGFDDQFLQTALDYDLKQHIRSVISDLEINLSFDRNNWLRANLTWCTQCLESGYHSILHQFLLLHHCPFHLTPLANQCPNCNSNIPFLLSDKKLTAPFTCKCGHRFTNLSNRWTHWGSAQTTINCSQTQKWLDLSKKKSDILSHLFIPAYAINNKNVLAYLIHALDESFLINEDEGVVCKTDFNRKSQSWNRARLNVPTHRTQKPDRINSRMLLNTFKDYENQEFYDFMYENSRQVFKAIDKYIRVTALRGHEACVERFQNVLKEEDQPFPPICPHAYAYVLWKQSILGYEKFYEHKIGAYRRENLHSFELIDRYFCDEQKELIGSFLQNSYNFLVDKPFELKWLVQKIAAAFLTSSLSAFRMCSENGAKQKLAPTRKLFESLVHDTLPFIVIRHPKNLASGVPITFFQFKKNNHEKGIDLECPNQQNKKINQMKERMHTPIAYSMRYYGGSDYPENYEIESRDIDKHVLGLCAPTKYLHY